MPLEPGDLVLVSFPFTDLSASKSRPALVLSNGDDNRSQRDVIVLGVTSNLTAAAHSVLIEPRDLASGRLLATSRVKVDKCATLDQRLVRKVIGQVRPGILANVLKEFLALLPDLHR